MDVLPTLDLTLSPPEDWTEDDIGRVIKVVKPLWTLERLEWKRLSGGRGNHTVKCWLDQTEDNEGDYNVDESALVVRVTKMMSEEFPVGNAISVTRVLAQNDLCAPPLVRFNNGVVYPFVPGETATADIFTDATMYKQVARKLAAIHSINPNDTLPESEKINQKPNFLDNIRKTIVSLPNITSLSVTNRDSYSSLIVMLKAEIISLLGVCSDYESTFPAVLSHGDCTVNNFLVDKGSVKLIDFDYTGYNIQSRDIGHFLVAGRMEFIPPKAIFHGFTSEEETDFVRTYLEEFSKRSGEDGNVLEHECQEFLKQCQHMKLSILLWAASIFMENELTKHEKEITQLWLIKDCLCEYTRLKNELFTD